MKKSILATLTAGMILLSGCAGTNMKGYEASDEVCAYAMDIDLVTQLDEWEYNSNTSTITFHVVDALKRNLKDNLKTREFRTVEVTVYYMTSNCIIEKVVKKVMNLPSTTLTLPYIADTQINYNWRVTWRG